MDNFLDKINKNLTLYINSLINFSKKCFNFSDISNIYRFHYNFSKTTFIRTIIDLKVENHKIKEINSIFPLLEFISRIYNSLDINSTQNICLATIRDQTENYNQAMKNLAKDAHDSSVELKELKDEYEAYSWNNQYDYKCKMFESRIDRNTISYKKIVQQYHESIDAFEESYKMRDSFNLENYKNIIEDYIEIINTISVEKIYIKDILLNYIYNELELNNKLLISFDKFEKIVNLRYSLPVNEKLKVSKQIWYVIIHELSPLISNNEHSEWENQLLKNMHFDRKAYIKHRNDYHKDLRKGIHMIVKDPKIKELAQYNN